MIKARRGLVVFFKGKKPGERWPEELVAWGDEGEPMIWDADAKRLVDASSRANFDDIGEEKVIVQLIPAPGWRAWYDMKGKLEFCPLVAWGLDSNGHVHPIESDDLGCMEDPTEATNFKALRHESEPALDEHLTS